MAVNFPRMKRFLEDGKNGGRKRVGSAINRRRANGKSLNIKERERERGVV